MATELLDGHIVWEGVRDEEGNRAYTIAHLVLADTTDGPANVMQTPGLPVPGDMWLVDADVDVWAFCKKGMRVDLHQPREGEPHRYWRVTQTFSTKPDKVCQEHRIEDPLLEPPKVSGGFVRFTEEATNDRHGEPILYSSHEVVRGPQVEFEKGRHKVQIVMNVATWEQVITFLNAIDHVNDDVLWGMPYRSVRLSDVSWEQKYYGTCSIYYTVSSSFEVNTKYDALGIDNVNLESGWDRDILDEGTKVLQGNWEVDSADNTKYRWRLRQYLLGGVPFDPDPDDPTDFQRFTDPQGNQCRVILNGHGLPAETRLAGTFGATTDIGRIHIEYYHETDFTLLGIPTDFDLIS